jgi:hypothetical protein
MGRFTLQLKWRYTIMSVGLAPLLEYIEFMIVRHSSSFHQKLQNCTVL